MTEKSIVTSKNFGTKLSGATRSIKTASANLQDLLVFAGEDYLASGDSGFLKKLVNACVGVQGLATNKMINYIVEASDLKCISIEIKSGKNAGKKERVFKREKAGNDTPKVFELPSYDWTQYQKPDEEAKAWDESAYLGNVIKKYEKELPTLKGKAQQEALKHLVSIKMLAGDTSLTEVKAAKKAA